MEITVVIGIILLLLFVGVLYYGQKQSDYRKNVYPFRPQYLFDTLKHDYLLLSKGRIAENYFISKYEGKCSLIHPNDSGEMISFKQAVLRMIHYPDFLEKALNNAASYQEFMEAWSHYEPNKLPFNESVPYVFQEGKGLEIMTRMVDAGFCDRDTLAWRQDDKPTDLMGLFVDAISKELNLKPKGRMAPFKEIWGDRNFSQYLKNAANRVIDEKQRLLDEVHKILPDYTIPIIE